MCRKSVPDSNKFAVYLKHSPASHKCNVNQLIDLKIDVTLVTDILFKFPNTSYKIREIGDCNSNSLFVTVYHMDLIIC